MLIDRPSVARGVSVFDDARRKSSSGLVLSSDGTATSFAVELASGGSTGSTGRSLRCSSQAYDVLYKHHTALRTMIDGLCRSCDFERGVERSVR